MKETFARQIRAAIQELGAGGREFSFREIAADKLDMVRDADRRRLRKALRDFFKSGELERLAPGRYRLIKQPKTGPALQEVMWRLLRSRRSVTVEDLVELSGASAKYAEEWLQMLAKRNIVRRTTPLFAPGVFRLISDPVELPVNDTKIDRLRGIRAEKKKALASLDQVWGLISQARLAISSIPDETQEQADLPGKEP